MCDCGRVKETGYNDYGVEDQKEYNKRRQMSFEEMEKMNEPSDFIYNPEWATQQVQKGTIGVKFANDVFIMEAYLKDSGIEYKPEDLEMTPLGLAYRVKK